ncbi:DUF2235 domain-containing protein [Terracidiphilus gabretensis]|uniref:DUF2235 domain-containing protein n=1 Tax=Terracidiphilus gabretensis TaxID=1577687 RepID=UPI00071B4BBA|nr:DUF2235 domain-containing protein [Terracidiphilus gabretensis]
MSKRIVFCSDGTWQAPLNNTNVYRLYKALAVADDQITFYDDGVGADATGLSRILEGAFGQGLLQKIQDSYTKIAHVYEPGDQIFLFGFSRGAYTARSLAGMIATCGLPGGSFTNDCVTQAFTAYRTPTQRASILAGLSASNLQQASIQMVGVWDTVGSLGIPAIFGGINESQYGFLDTSLHPCVKNAFQCLALDEKRMQFPATLWDGPAAPGQTLEQVWFSGCHGDVGGGTAQGGPMDAGTRLCDVTMGWMVSRAQQCGLTFVDGTTAQFATLPADSALDLIRETWTPADGPPHLRPVASTAEVANSVAVRLQYALTYVPGSLTVTDGELADSYAIQTIVSENAF